jgi:hypothetical protein
MLFFFCKVQRIYKITIIQYYINIMSEYILSFDPGSINMAYCLIEIATLRICKWGIFSIKDSTGEGSAIKLANHLDELKLTDDIDVTIIFELQPRVNIKTILISGFITMYYAQEKRKLDTPGTIEKIVGFHARYKIKYYQPEDGEKPLPPRLDKLKKGHYRNKQILIEHCRRILPRHNADWIPWFESAEKLDDKSDCMCQALMYIKMNKLGPYSQ